MKYKPTHFYFHSKSTGEELSFVSPNDAIKYFESKGYGMHNWNIEMTVNTGVNEIRTSITLLTFNVITDHWSAIQ